MFAVLAQVLFCSFSLPLPLLTSSRYLILAIKFQKLTMGEGGYIGYDAWFPIAPGHALGRYVQIVFCPPPMFCVCDYLDIRLFTSPSPLAAVTATTTGDPSAALIYTQPLPLPPAQLMLQFCFKSQN
jgi:hypothetical protein